MVKFQRQGDKENSAFFEHYLQQIYEVRDRSGVKQNVGELYFVLIQVERTERDRYLEELSLMTAYTYTAAYEGFGHLFTVMEYDEEHPAIVVVTDLDDGHDLFEAMNRHSIRGVKKPHTRYIGEVFKVQDARELEQSLKAQSVRFFEGDFPFLMTYPSEYTWNSVMYLEEAEERGFLRDGFVRVEEPDLLPRLEKAKARQMELDITHRLDPIDHLATRVFSHDREHAILEFMKLSSYYYWGSYLIADQNSSTNVTRNTRDLPEYLSPAKVFTAAETPYYLDHLTGLPSPTEDFVIQYGRRMHHIAHGVNDSVDEVVKRLKGEGVDFLLKVIGSEEEGIKQVFSRASDESYLITEYVQRFNGFKGFFTKKNVGFLTKAAAVEYDSVAEKNLCD